MTAVARTPASGPAIADPVVVDGRKYRIREITPAGTAVLRTSFGNFWSSVPLAWLVWDPAAGVWRPRSGEIRRAAP